MAALSLFAERGVSATSLRAVAKAAVVSPALVVHHFGSKDGVVAAVDEVALRAFGDAYADAAAAGPDLLRSRAEQTVRVMREQPEVCAYLGRALVEGTPGSRDLFRSVVAGGREQIDALAEQGALRGDADRLWATLQHFFLIWAPLSFIPLLDEVLDGTLLDAPELERWAGANVDLLARGLYR